MKLDFENLGLLPIHSFTLFELKILRNLVDTRISRIVCELDSDTLVNQHRRYLSRSLNSLSSLSSKLSRFIDLTDL